MEAIWVAAEMRAGGAYAPSVIALDALAPANGDALAPANGDALAPANGEKSEHDESRPAAA
jgi:hypothetical protein